MTHEDGLDHAEFAWRSVYGGRHVCIECAPTREAAVAAVDGQSVEDAGRAALAAQCVGVRTDSVEGDRRWDRHEVNGGPGPGRSQVSHGLRGARWFAGRAHRPAPTQLATSGVRPPRASTVTCCGAGAWCVGAPWAG